MVQKDNIKNKLIIICGPTASGKTALAVELAKLLDTEVISADSMYIYKGLNIGTAKPSISEMHGVKHHLIDVVSAFEEFSVSDYKSLATPIVEDLFSRGKTPIICGGTGFYINSILYDLSYGKSCANVEAREKYNHLAKEKGNLYVYNILKEVDVASAEKIHFNDIKRVIRALEIYESGQKKSEIKDDITPKYDYVAYSYDTERSILYDRINKRVDLMFDNGLIDEVENLIKNNVSIENQCMQGIGYKEVVEYLSGKISHSECSEKIKLNTRHYAKRQITFFKRLQNLKFLKYIDAKEDAKRIIEEYDR